MTVTLRRVEKKKHARALAALTLELARYERLEPPSPEALERLAEDALRGRKIRAVLAYVEGEPVGYSVSFETYSTFQGRPVFYLEDLFVLPEHRRCGVGAKLFLDCVKRAKKRRCCRVEWQVLAWNEPAIHFYEKLRAEKMTDWIWHRLAEDKFV
jgi:GNAT superfamily N-acetyltransferase